MFARNERSTVQKLYSCRFHCYCPMKWCKNIMIQVKSHINSCSKDVIFLSQPYYLCRRNMCLLEARNVCKHENGKYKHLVNTNIWQIQTISFSVSVTLLNCATMVYGFPLTSRYCLKHVQLKTITGNEQRIRKQGSTRAVDLKLHTSLKF